MGWLDEILRLLGNDAIRTREIPAEDIGRNIGRKLGLGPAYGDTELGLASAYGGIAPRKQRSYSALDQPQPQGMSLDDAVGVPEYHPSLQSLVDLVSTGPQISDSTLQDRQKPRTMRMTLNGRDITDVAGALTGGFGLPQGTVRNGGGFSESPVLRVNGKPDWAPVEEMAQNNDVDLLRTQLATEILARKPDAAKRASELSQAIELAKRNRLMAPFEAADQEATIAYKKAQALSSEAYARSADETANDKRQADLAMASLQAKLDDPTTDPKFKQQIEMAVANGSDPQKLAMFFSRTGPKAPVNASSAGDVAVGGVAVPEATRPLTGAVHDDITDARQLEGGAVVVKKKDGRWYSWAGGMATPYTGPAFEGM